MIELKDVSFAYEHRTPVLDHVSFHIRKGEKAGLIGANGAGKSTILKLICGLLQGQGEIRISGIPVTADNLAQIRKMMGFVMQNSDQQMFMPTVYDDMAFAPLNYGTDKKTTEQKIDDIMHMLGIEELKHRYNHRISGGEKRMAAIAAILTNDPEVILMDEPTSALDPANRRQIINIIRNMPETVLISSHDLDMILDTCDTVILLNHGTVVKSGPAEEILLDKELLESCHLELPLSAAGRQ